MIRAASSLTNRIFLASTLLATLSLGAVFYFVNAGVSAQAEAELRRDLDHAATLVEQRRGTLTQTFTRMARLVADLPKLKAAVETGDAPTVQPIAEEYRRAIEADLLVMTDPRGAVLGVAGADVPTLPDSAGPAGAVDETSAFLSHPRGVLQIVSVPILIGVDLTEILGRLTVGFFMDEQLASQFKDVTGADIAFAADGQVLASSLPESTHAELATITHTGETTTIRLRDEEYLAMARPMEQDSPTAPTMLILRSRTERLQLLRTLRAGLAGALIVTILLATILSYGVALTMTRPLRMVTSAMRDVAATGDLTRKVTVQSQAWADEDARLLATAFNTLTDSIARFQREAAQKERLSSLGRLSTVIAHEVRNPLMIIRASLASLRSDTASAAERREAVADIDGETERLNRIVTEVLDFAKPIRFDLGEAQVNDVCRASVAAAWAGSHGAPVAIDLAPDLPTVMTDAERLRTALVNILSNARHAVEAADPPAATPSVFVSTRRHGDRVTIVVRDRGAGIAPEDMAHIVDPYYTTRRAGTGLGLPISKNIVEGLGGTLAISSRSDDGTEIRIDLPIVTADSVDTARASAALRHGTHADQAHPTAPEAA
jgi:signal transduction histidine kinase